MLEFFDTNVAKNVDVFKAVLLLSGKYSLLPELYDAFGEESFVKFLDIFAGTEFKVPSRTVIERIIRDVAIFLEMHAKTSTAVELAERFKLEPITVEMRYRRVRRLVDKLGLKVK